ncbi:protein of unknown function [Streptomyces sp. KY75]|nr:protein of unknown function [Streptomyces sp. KY75]CAD5987090.1 protein of unknown function [Streptomyces sp. KY70]
MREVRSLLSALSAILTRSDERGAKGVSDRPGGR